MQRYLRVLLAITVFIGFAAAMPADQKPPKRNLKVLDKDISHDDLDKVMDGFKAALGVKCNFCHAPSKDDSKKLDMSLDDKYEKGVAREMMEMTNRINKKFFEGKLDDHGQPLQLVTCATCHHGRPHPKFDIPTEEKH
jgi:hypothetical protein